METHAWLFLRNLCCAITPPLKSDYRPSLSPPAVNSPAVILDRGTYWISIVRLICWLINLQISQTVNKLWHARTRVCAREFRFYAGYCATLHAEHSTWLSKREIAGGKKHGYAIWKVEQKRIKLTRALYCIVASIENGQWSKPWAFIYFLYKHSSSNVFYQ